VTTKPSGNSTPVAPFGQSSFGPFDRGGGLLLPTAAPEPDADCVNCRDTALQAAHVAFAASSFVDEIS
jgi:hypothetical protein